MELRRAIDLVNHRLEYWTDVRFEDDQRTRNTGEVVDTVDWTEVLELSKVAADLSRAEQGR
jgi:hypothetical protein